MEFLIECVGFNPRPHARDDLLLMVAALLFSSFNPRPHARGDQSSTQTLLSRLVSIHAPTRGATCFYGNGEELIKFQSTPPREGRRSSTRTLRPNCCFNPRPHARGDKLRTYGGKLTEFQSTPPREGRHLVHADGKATLFVSIHAPTRGATN